jgi:ABC-2 type transport system permease protein
MRKILRIFGMMWGTNLAYRADVFLWTLTEAATPLVTLAIWFAVAKNGTFVLTPEETLTYYIFIFFVRSVTRSWASFFLSQEILNGDIVRYLIKPLSVFWEHIADNITTKIFRLLVPAILLAFVLWQKPEFFSSTIFDGTRVMLFVASLLLATILSFVFDAIFATLAFWVEDSLQISAFQFVFGEFATGILIPFAAMPIWLFTALSWLPFRYMVSAPIELLMNQVSGARIAPLFITQLIWIGVSLGILRILWKQGTKNYAIPGQ